MSNTETTSSIDTVIAVNHLIALVAPIELVEFINAVLEILQEDSKVLDNFLQPVKAAPISPFKIYTSESIYIYNTIVDDIFIWLYDDKVNRAFFSSIYLQILNKSYLSKVKIIKSLEKYQTYNKINFLETKETSTNEKETDLKESFNISTNNPVQISECQFENLVHLNFDNGSVNVLKLLAKASLQNAKALRANALAIETNSDTIGVLSELFKEGDKVNIGSIEVKSK